MRILLQNWLSKDIQTNDILTDEATSEALGFACSKSEFKQPKEPVAT